MYLDDLTPKGYAGVAYGNRIEMDYNLDNEDFLSVLLHEVQHIVQDMEGFARGGTSSKMMREYIGSQISIEMDNILRTIGEDKRKLILDNMSIVSKQDDIDKLVDLAHNRNPRTPYQHFYKRGDWYKYSRDIQDEFGLPPKKAGWERDRWVNNVAMWMANKKRSEIPDIEYHKMKLERMKSEGSPELKNVYSRLERKLNKMDKENKFFEKASRRTELKDIKHNIDNMTDYEMYKSLHGS